MSDSKRAVVQRLYRERGRSAFLRVSLWGLLVLVVLAWSSDVVALSDLFQARRLESFARFFREDVLPAPLRESSVSASAVWAWLAEWFVERAIPALRTTVPIAVIAIFIAALGSLPGAIFGARPPASADAAGTEPTRLGLARSFLFRALAVLARAVPEYVLAFCLLGLLGLGPWPAVIALALHNGGILARLGADAVEDLEVAPLLALRTTGARESRVLMAGILPGAFSRFLLYFFYRFETCIRESTALGLLGIVSLGYFVEEARAHQKYDELVLLMLLAAGLFAAADYVSIRARRWLESAGGR